MENQFDEIDIEYEERPGNMDFDKPHQRLSICASATAIAGIINYISSAGIDIVKG